MGGGQPLCTQFPLDERPLCQARMSGDRVGSEQAPTTGEALGKFPHQPGLCFPICKTDMEAERTAIRGTSDHMLSVQEVSAAMALAPEKSIFFGRLGGSLG